MKRIALIAFLSLVSTSSMAQQPTDAEVTEAYTLCHSLSGSSKTGPRPRPGLEPRPGWEHCPKIEAEWKRLHPDTAVPPPLPVRPAGSPPLSIEDLQAKGKSIADRIK